MTDQPLCPLCPPDRARPLHDNAYVCPGCTNHVGDLLHRLATIAGEAGTTVARLGRIGGGAGRRTGPDQPLPVNLGAGSRHDAAVTELLTRARMVAEERGQDLPAVRSITCRHRTCQSIRSGAMALPGPACEQIVDQPIAVLAGWLAEQLEWLRHHPDGEVALRDIRSACWALERVIDRPADHDLVGRCGCETVLYARRGATTVTCKGCNTTYDVEECRAGLLDALSGSLFTAAELAGLATYLGLRTQRDRVRKLIWAWANRGLITAHGLIDGDPAYRCGEIMTRLMATQSAA